MAIFQYTGTDLNGNNLRGIVEADSSKIARQKLKRNNIVLLSIQEQSLKKNSSAIFLKFLGKESVSFAEVTLMTRQLASLIKANIPLVEALAAVIDQIENERFKVILADIRQQVNEGSSLQAAIAKHDNIFSPIFINMVGAGEASGTLSIVLIRLAEFLESQSRLRSKIMAAMAYPILMLFIGGVLMLGIFTFVIPKIAKIFDSMNKSMPWYTNVILKISEFTLAYWWILIIGFFVFMWFFRTYIASPKGKKRKDKVMLKLPVLGDLIRVIAVNRFSNTMATLLNGGVSIISALNITKAVVNNVVLAEAIDMAIGNISEGQSLAGPLKKSGEFPKLVIHMITIGERTGELPEMLQSVSNTYEEIVDIQVTKLTTLLEPLMIIVMGVVVGIIVMAVFAPLLQLQQVT